MKKKTLTQLAKFGTAAVVSAMLFGTVSAFPAAAETADVRLMGDLNGDLDVNIEDAFATLQIYACGVTGLESNAVSDGNYTVDIDMDGEISMEDAKSILVYYSKALTGYKPMWAEFREVSYVAGDDSFVKPDGSAFVKRDIYVEIGSAAAAPGTDVTIPVYVAGLDGLAGAVMWLTPPEGLELTKIVINPEVAEKARFETYLLVGSAVWVEQHGLDLEIADGTVLFEYTYHIPEDAVPGTHYLLTDAPGHTQFTTSYGSIIADYGCTILSGVISVK